MTTALNTDLYELTMAAGYFAAGRTEEIATFELTTRRLPEQRNFLVAAGLQQAIEYLLDLHFEPDDIDYLRSLPHFRQAPRGFFKFLADLHFTGDLFAPPEGTPIFPGEPLAIIRAPVVQAQLVETYLLSTFSFQTMIASKAVRCVTAGDGRSIVEFGSRRAHSPGAGVLGARASYIGGCTGTSNTLAGKTFGIPVFGTSAHSWIMSFPDEKQSFQILQQLLGDGTVYLVDTYDTSEGARKAASLGMPCWGVRLDSGDLLTLSKTVRQILDQSGLPGAKIFATNDLDEYRIAELLATGAPIDAFGVGTQLSTSGDAPNLAAVYKLVELNRGAGVVYTAKLSEGKSTLPGAKQVFRCRGYDFLALGSECSPESTGEPLIRPVLMDGIPIETLPSTPAIRAYSQTCIADLPAEVRSLRPSQPYPVQISQRLLSLADNVHQQHQNGR